MNTEPILPGDTVTVRLTWLGGFHEVTEFAQDYSGTLTVAGYRIDGTEERGTVEVLAAVREPIIEVPTQRVRVGDTYVVGASRRYTVVDAVHIDSTVGLGYNVPVELSDGTVSLIRKNLHSNARVIRAEADAPKVIR